MSRLTVTNQHDLASIICQLTGNAAKSNHRALLFCDSANSDLLQNFIKNHGIRILHTDSAKDRADDISAVLGAEHEQLAIKMGKLPDVGLLAAAAGTVVAGGLLILILDADCRSADTPSTQRFLRLLDDSFANNPSHMRHITCDFLIQKPSSNSPDIQTSERPQALQASAEEQDQQLSLAIDHWQNHQNACIVITGDRGRGKSRLMTRLANHLHDCSQNFQVTAQHRSALSIYDKYKNHTNDYFLPAEQAVRTSGQRLLIEEAGNFPIAQLHQFLSQYRQVLLCTTIDGYETSGRAFANRFMPSLTAHTPHILLLTPTVCWRWAMDDALEILINRLLVNYQSSIDVTKSKCFDITTDDDVITKNSRQRMVSQAELAEDESLLKSVFTLLRDNHYQSTAKDILHLLDAPDLLIAIQSNNDLVLAATVIVLEGRLNAELSEAIVSKSRRLPHHLLPQLLAQTANRDDALSQQYARVIRIAVKQGYRRRGLGSSLLSFAETHLRKDRTKIAAIGASFAGDPDNLAFWESQRYRIFHQGFKPNPRTGVRSVALLKTFNSKLTQVLDNAIAIHTDNLLWQNNPVAAGKQLSEFSDPGQIYQNDLPLLNRFAQGQRSLQDSFAAIHRLAYRLELDITQGEDQTRKHYEKAMRELVQQCTKTDKAIYP